MRILIFTLPVMFFENVHRSAVFLKTYACHPWDDMLRVWNEYDKFKYRINGNNEDKSKYSFFFSWLPSTKLVHLVFFFFFVLDIVINIQIRT